MAGSWSDTALWTALQGGSSENEKTIAATLQQFMRTVETVLEKAGTSGQSFTLHDAGHSFRVAQRMSQVIPEDVFGSLSAYEHGLLLLSAYLHDIGMTPEGGRLAAHRAFLVDGDESALSDVEREAFIAWLEAAGFAFPVELPIQEADWILDRYVRACHVEWGDEWTREEICDLSFGDYKTWQHDLRSLCRSHHEGYERLASADFAPRNVDSEGGVVHLRYLAFALRVADVLEFDPERTPEAVYRHRAIEPASKIYWYKDHDIALGVEDAKQVTITARPSSALIHKAVEETANDVDDELALCRHLADTHPVQARPGSQSPLPHRWDLPARAWRDIQPEAGKYEYIDGAFRPNTDRVLELVAGTALYSNPFAAVRELMSNGLDAIRAAMALERNSQVDGGPVSAEGGKKHRLRLEMVAEDGRWWLCCRDTGIGMDKGAIERHFLVAGSPVRSRLLDLARRSREAGFEFERSGEFGIGVLSYFMLADRIAMTTREVGGTEGGWTFEVEGLEGFGELRPVAEAEAGTMVKLRLREDLFADAEEWAGKLASYVRATIHRSSCVVEVSLGSAEENTWQAGPGWTADVQSFTEDLLGGLVHRRSEERVLELMSKESREEAQELSDHASQVLEDARRRLRWHVVEGDLSDGIGAYRAAIPYWELDGGPSRVYLQACAEDGGVLVSRFEHRPYGDRAYLGGSSVKSSWYGMRSEIDRHTQIELERLMAAVVEVDLHSARAGEIRLRRDQASLSDDAEKALSQLVKELRQISARFSSDLGGSVYRSLNMVIAGGDGEANGDWYWCAGEDPDESVPWEQMRFPCVVPSSRRSAGPGRASIKRKRVELYSRLSTAGDHAGGFPWHCGAVSPDRVVWFEDHRPAGLLSDTPIGVGLLWREAPSRFREDEPLLAEFPPEWASLCGIRWKGYGGGQGYAAPSYAYLQEAPVIWNSSHPLIGLADEGAISWAEDLVSGPRVRSYAHMIAALDPLNHREALEDRARAAAWFMALMSVNLTRSSPFWSGIAERDSGFLPSLWQRLGLANGEEVAEVTFLTLEENSTYMNAFNRIDPSGWERVELRSREDWSLLPVPDGDEWRLSIRPSS